MTPKSWMAVVVAAATGCWFLTFLNGCEISIDLSRLLESSWFASSLGFFSLFPNNERQFDDGGDDGSEVPPKSLTAYSSSSSSPGVTIQGISPSDRAKALVGNMTLEEKVGLLHGYGPCHYIGCARGVSRLGIPDLRLNDGPQGFRTGEWEGYYVDGTSTSFPAGLAIAASFDEVAAREWGRALGEEFYDKGANVMLGPGMCLARTPWNGRNFEYLAGEDPLLGYHLARAAVEGIQSRKVIANAKHFVLNNQETLRTSISVRGVSKRTRMELYYPPFVGALRGDVGSIMCSYNRITTPEDNVTSYSCEHDLTLRREYKQELGFDGFVMSDWGATHSTAESLAHGLDQEMPGGTYFGDALREAAEKGEVPMEGVDAAVEHVLVPMIKLGMLDEPNNTNLPNATVTSQEHREAARSIAANGMVLLKNTPGTLPLDIGRPNDMKIAVLGAASASSQQFSGGGSGHVSTYREICSYNALWRAVVGSPDARPRSCAVQPNATYRPANDDAPSYECPSPDECCRYCSERVGCEYWTFDEKSKRCQLMTSVRTDETGPEENKVSGALFGNRTLRPCDATTGRRCVTLVDGFDDVVAAAKAASIADVAVVFVQTNSGEGSDRPTLSLGDDQDKLVATVAGVMKRNAKRTVVVVTTPGAVLLPWANDVDAILVGFMPGEQTGNAVADVLLGKVSPSGRLPVTFPNVENEMQMSKRQYPGDEQFVDYEEGLLVGYRWYHTKEVTPRYPFGHGMSYSTFAFSEFLVMPSSRAVVPRDSLTALHVSATVTNTGAMAAREVVMVYLSYPSTAQEPPRQMKAFAKTEVLGPGESAAVSFELSRERLSIYSDTANEWQVPCGTFFVYMASSGDTPATDVRAFSASCQHPGGDVVFSDAFSLSQA